MTWTSRGRTEPYTDAGIKRAACARCDSPASSQWQVCADRRRYRALCTSCDIDLNRLVLTWAGDPDVDRKMVAYEAEQRA